MRSIYWEHRLPFIYTGMNYIGIDPSLISTAVVINGKLFNYCREENATTTKGGLSKWYSMCEPYVTYRWIKYNTYKNYSDGELVKLKDYDAVSDMIISDILANIDLTQPTKIGAEGYSYSSDAGNLIDLVTFSTLLRKKLYDKVSTNIIILSPMTLKQECCKMTYKPVDIGKKKEKLEWRNNEGIAGGKFTKREILLSISENDKLNDSWSKHIVLNKDEMLESKTIKKPMEDLNDAYVIYNLLSSGQLS
jgi:hypothetical protein